MKHVCKMLEMYTDMREMVTPVELPRESSPKHEKAQEIKLFYFELRLSLNVSVCIRAHDVDVVVVVDVLTCRASSATRGPPSREC